MDNPIQKYPKGSLVFILFYSQIRFGIIESAEWKMKDNNFGFYYKIKYGTGKQATTMYVWEWDLAANNPIDLIDRYVKYANDQYEQYLQGGQ